MLPMRWLQRTPSESWMQLAWVVSCCSSPKNIEMHSQASCDEGVIVPDANSENTMSLQRLELKFEAMQLPAKVSDLLNALAPHVEQHRVDIKDNYRGFVPCDYELAYQQLAALYASHELCGDRFCEWGSGLGVVACLASMVGFESCGIEWNDEIATLSQQLADQNAIQVDLVSGSFIPQGAEHIVDDAYSANDGDIALYTEADDAYGQLGMDADSFDLIFAFPWPNDLELVKQIFYEYAATGAVLMTYNDREAFSLLRKV